MSEKHIADAEGSFVVSNVTPDFCRVGKDILPFDICNTLEPEKASYAKTVFARSAPTLMIDSIIKGVVGNAGKGLKSGVSVGSGDSQIIEGSGSVFIEGRKAARQLDEVLMNGQFAPAPAGNTKPSGLGPGADRLIAQSPTLQADLEQLKKDGWAITYGPEGAGSACYRTRNPPTIVLDGALKQAPGQAVQVLSHEVGHAMHPFNPDYSSMDKYVNAALADEGAATLKNIQVQREILANSGPNIGIAGNQANHAAYNRIFDAATQKPSTSMAGARAQIGELFRTGEFASGSTPPKNYGQFYSDWYKSTVKK